jgi:hypothetical protein
MLTPLYREGQRRQSQPGETFEHYEIRSRVGRLQQEDPAAARRGSVHLTDHGNTPTLVSRAKSPDTGSVSQQLSRSPDSRGLPERPTQAQSSPLSALARSFVGLGLGNYLECSHFIADNPNILARSEIEALMAEASIAERAGQSSKAQTCVHQALLLRECNRVGLKNIGSFFRELNGKDSRTKNSFILDVKKVYKSVQQQEGRTPEQRKGPNPEPQGGKSVVTLQPIEQKASQNSYTSTQYTEENIPFRNPVASTPGGKLYYTDAQGNLLLPASTRHDPERHGSQSDPTKLSGSFQAAPGETSTANAKGRQFPGRIRRSAASDPAVSLPSLPEDYKYESTRIGGTAGIVEKLDEREYLWFITYPILTGLRS